MKHLLEHRKIMRSKKPKFIRRYAGKIKKLSIKWTKPRGKSHKIRLKKIGKPKAPSVGYRAPKKIRSFHISGLKMILVHSLNQLININKKEEAVIIAKNIGLKKKLQLLQKCQELNVNVLNVKDINKYLALKREELDKKKQEKKNKQKKKTKSKEEALKKAEEKKQKAEEDIKETKEEEQKIEKETLMKEQIKKERQPKQEKMTQEHYVKQGIIPGEKS